MTWWPPFRASRPGAGRGDSQPPRSGGAGSPGPGREPRVRHAERQARVRQSGPGEGSHAGDVGLVRARAPGSGPALRPADDAPKPGIHRRDRSLFGVRHGREHRDVQLARRGRAAQAACTRSAAAGGAPQRLSGRAAACSRRIARDLPALSRSEPWAVGSVRHRPAGTFRGVPGWSRCDDDSWCVRHRQSVSGPGSPAGARQADPA